MVSQARGQDALVTDRAMSEDQHDLRMAHRQVREPICERRQSPTGVNQDRHPSVFCEREYGAHLRAVEYEVLRARMQLDAACSRRQAAFTLEDRIFGGIQATKGREPALAFRGPRDDPIVRNAVGGSALGVVQRKHARALGVRIIELGQ